MSNGGVFLDAPNVLIDFSTWTFVIYFASCNVRRFILQYVGRNLIA